PVDTAAIKSAYTIHDAAGQASYLRVFREGLSQPRDRLVEGRVRRKRGKDGPRRRWRRGWRRRMGRRCRWSWRNLADHRSLGGEGGARRFLCAAWRRGRHSIGRISPGAWRQFYRSVRAL